MSNRANAAGPRGGMARVLVVAVLGLCALLACGGSAALAASLPDGRAYELVTPLDKNGLEVGAGVPSLEGNAVNWEAPGGCCGSSSAAQTLYQSSRANGGWQTKALTPTPNRPLLGTTEEQNPVFWTGDLSQTIFSTPASYAAGDERPTGSAALDLYLQGPSGSLSWLSQGPFAGSGSVPDTATFDGATPDAGDVVFSSPAQLTPEATGASTEPGTPPPYLYERNVAGATTSLVNVSTTTLSAGATAGATSIKVASTAEFSPYVTLYESNSSLSTEQVPREITIGAGAAQETVDVKSVLDATELTLGAPLANGHAAGEAVTQLTDPFGAALGDASVPGSFLGGNSAGTTTNAVSEDGAKVFFESPASSEAFFRARSEEPFYIIPHLYMRDMQGGTTTPLDNPLAAAAHVRTGLKNFYPSVSFEGASRDGSLAFFTTNEMLSGGLGELVPGLGNNELYEFNSTDKQIGPAPPMSVVPVSRGSYGETPKTTLTESTLAPFATTLTAATTGAFHSGLTESAGPAVATTLTANATAGESVIVVASTTNLGVGERVAIDTGAAEETARIEAVLDGTELMLSAPLGGSHVSGAAVTHAAGSSLAVESTVGFAAGQPVLVGAEPATIAAVTDATHLLLSAPLSEVQTGGASVAYAGDTSIAVASTANFATGQPITVDGVKTSVAAVPDGTHLTLSAPLVEAHPLGAEVSYDGVSIAVASTSGFSAGSQIAVDTGETAQTAIVAAVTDGTHFELSAPLKRAYGPGTAIVQSPIAEGSVVGVTAVANDGSRVYFIANGVLAANANAHGQKATAKQPNMYVFDTHSGQTTFVATVAWPDADECQPSCQEPRPVESPEEQTNTEVPSTHPGPLVAEPDTTRPAVPTPDGSVLVFDSSGNLTGQDPGPASTLTAEALERERTLTLASTKGFAAGQTVTIGSGVEEELGTVETVNDATHLTLSETGPSGVAGLYTDHAAGSVVTQLHSEVYRYDANDNSLTCLSCVSAGATPTGSATLGAAGGGSYGPPMTAVPMSEDGSKVFFQTPDALVPEDVNGGSFANGPFGSTAESSDVYEWENGKVSLISDGRSTAGAFLDGTTPSGNDVFFTTQTQLTPWDTDGFGDIYDARVGGGFAAPATGPAPCSGQNCRPRGASVFFSVPASATLTGKGNVTPLSVSAPSFSVAAITAAQKAKAAKSGSLALSVSATAGGKLSAGAFAAVGGKSQKVASASATLGGAGKATLSLRLSSAARKALAKKGKLALRVEVSYSESGTVKVATLTLKRTQTKARKKGRKAAVRRAAAGKAAAGNTAAGEAAVGTSGAGGSAVSPVVRGRGRGA